MFFGREEQLGQLDSLWGKRVSSLVTCRGRRRVGKSTLMEEFARRSGVRRHASAWRFSKDSACL